MNSKSKAQAIQALTRSCPKCGGALLPMLDGEKIVNRRHLSELFENLLAEGVIIIKDAEEVFQMALNRDLIEPSEELKKLIEQKRLKR